MGSPDNFSTNVSELLDIEMMKEAYCSTNRVNFKEQIRWSNYRHKRLAYMIQTMEYNVLHGSFDSDTVQTIRMSSYKEQLKST